MSNNETPGSSGLARQLSLKEAAEIARFSYLGLASLIRRGAGPRHARIGRCIRIDPADLRRWLDAHRTSPSSSSTRASQPTPGTPSDSAPSSAEVTAVFTVNDRVACERLGCSKKELRALETSGVIKRHTSGEILEESLGEAALDALDSHRAWVAESNRRKVAPQPVVRASKTQRAAIKSSPRGRRVAR